MRGHVDRRSGGVKNVPRRQRGSESKMYKFSECGYTSPISSTLHSVLTFRLLLKMTVERRQSINEPLFSHPHNRLLQITFAAACTPCPHPGVHTVFLCTIEGFWGALTGQTTRRCHRCGHRATCTTATLKARPLQPEPWRIWHPATMRSRQHSQRRAPWSRLVALVRDGDAQGKANAA